MLTVCPAMFFKYKWPWVLLFKLVVYVGARNGIIHKEFLPNCMLILMKHGRGLIVGEFIKVLVSLLFLLGGLAFYRMGA